MNKKKILIICTHNSARSQMAEGLINNLFGSKYRGFSAGTEATRVNPLAVEAMKDMNLNITHQYSKTTEEFKDISFDLVITVCDSARENCPYFPNSKKIIHLPFPDPSNTKGTHKSKLNSFIKIRDQIKDKLTQIL